MAGVVATVCTAGLTPALPNPSLAVTPPSGAWVVAADAARNVGLQGYTFHADVTMAMRHFPWFHFHVQGDGEYRRGDRYVLRLSGLPFSSGSRQIDLSMIDPSLWPHRYRYQEIGQCDGDTVFALHALHDPSLLSATVALRADAGVRWVDATYSDGTSVRMTVTSDVVDGYLVPVALEAEVDRPHMPLRAQASFGDYEFATTSPVQAAPQR